MEMIMAHFVPITEHFYLNMWHLTSSSSKFLSNVSVRENRCRAALIPKSGKNSKCLWICEKLTYLGIFEIADFKSDIKSKKFKMVDSK